jgi:hypothetical protein
MGAGTASDAAGNEKPVDRESEADEPAQELNRTGGNSCDVASELRTSDGNNDEQEDNWSDDPGPAALSIKLSLGERGKLVVKGSGFVAPVAGAVVAPVATSQALPKETPAWESATIILAEVLLIGTVALLAAIRRLGK